MSADDEQLQLLGLVLRYQSIFEAIDKWHNDQSSDNTLEIQRQIKLLIERERDDARDIFWVALVFIVPLALLGLRCIAFGENINF